ncbi:hypothetical protein BY996DRAFT_8161234 [Phakopsora pachyrhizi]|nr:hypothetical protein BY996DRAFT_8161234 [Phakopsora pachyrhizi]
MIFSTPKVFGHKLNSARALCNFFILLFLPPYCLSTLNSVSICGEPVLGFHISCPITLVLFFKLFVLCDTLAVLYLL